MEWRLSDSLGISNRGTKAHRTPPGSFALCESVVLT
ncbi:hypothetical protein ACVWXS_000186 [Lysinibacillus sp. TE18511]